MPDWMPLTGSVQAVKLQAAGVPQDPPMFKALVSLLDERGENEPLHAAAYIALAPIRPYIIGGSGAGQFPPDGGWEKWLDKITTEQAGRRDLLQRLRRRRQRRRRAASRWICSAPGVIW